MAYIGIDLGTTNTVAAVVNPRTRRVEILEIGETVTDVPIGERKLIRSVVSSRNGQYLRGWHALASAQLDPKNTIFSIKRLMGRGYNDRQEYGTKTSKGKLIRELMRNNWDFEIVKPMGATEDAVAVILEGREYSPQEISRHILLEAKCVAEACLGETVEGAVITVPAYFNEKQCSATVEAAKMAGITVQRILDEPTAAAEAYARDTLSLTPRTVLVYDFGGGTFDVSLLEITGPNITVETIDGDNWLGGDDFTREIVNDLVEMIRKNQDQDPRNDPVLMFELRMRAEKAKEELSDKEETEITIGDLFPGLSPGIAIVREKENLKDTIKQNPGRLIIPRAYNDMIIDYVDETLELIEKVLERKGYEYQEIDKVLLIGGASKTPLIREKLAELFGQDKLETSKVDPMLAVAIGAAYVSESLFLGEKVICPWHLENGTPCNSENKIGTKKCTRCGKPLPIPDSGSIAERPYGIEVYNSEKKRNEFDVIIHKDDNYPLEEPAQVVRYIGTSGARIFKVRFFAGKKWEGGEFHPDVENNEYQGTVWMLLPPETPPGSEVIIGFNLDKNKEMVDISIECAGKEVKKEMISRGGREETLGKKIEEVMETLQRFHDERIIKENENQQLMGKAAAAMSILIDSYRAPAEESKKQLLDQITEKLETLEKEIEDLPPPPDDGLFIGAKGMRNYGYFVLNTYYWLPFLQEESRKAEVMEGLRELEHVIKRGEEALAGKDEETVNRELGESMFLTFKVGAFLADRNLDMFESIRISILAARGEFQIRGGNVVAGPWKTRPESSHKAGKAEGLQDAAIMQEGYNTIIELLKRGKVTEAEEIYRKIEPVVFKWIIKGGM